MQQNSAPAALIVATTCPDQLSPSAGQRIAARYPEWFSKAQVVDMVQGCAGGVSSLILASQWAETLRQAVWVVHADAAAKATSVHSPIHEVFNDGGFACEVLPGSPGLLHAMSRQYADCTEVVQIALGHDADAVIAAHIETMHTDPRLHLGLRLDNALAIRLMRKAEGFYLEFTAQAGHPDVLILHQVNTMIIDHLEQVFAPYPCRFINVARRIGNCGAATTGIALHEVFGECRGRRVMLCSFGTGGVISAGLWQF